MLKRLLFLLVTLLFVFPVQTVYGHSFAVEKIPAENSILTESPEKISITFDKKVDKELAEIQIYDENKKSVTNDLTEVTEDRQTITLSLPDLPNGIYHVEFQVISSKDGHPIRGEYDFKINKPKEAALNPDLPVPKLHPLIDDKLITVESTAEKDRGSHIDWSSLFHFSMRFIYFSGLMLLVGWVFWRLMMPSKQNEIMKNFQFWGIIFQMVHILGLIAMILIQLNMFIDFGLSVEHSGFSFESSFGMVWLASLLLSMIGFVCLFKNKWFDLTFVLLLVLAKSVNGHAAEYDPMLLLVISNAIHIMAGSVWVAGLAILVLFSRKYRMYTKDFLPHFSKAALLSICLVSISGTVLFLFIDSNLSSSWTLMLVLKVCAVVGVVVVGGIIRLKMKKGPVWNLVKLDFSLSLLIILIVSIFTYLNPAI